jgi:hypothetical protein
MTVVSHFQKSLGEQKKSLFAAQKMFLSEDNRCPFASELFGLLPEFPSAHQK